MDGVELNYFITISVGRESLIIPAEQKPGNATEAVDPLHKILGFHSVLVSALANASSQAPLYTPWNIKGNLVSRYLENKMEIELNDLETTKRANDDKKSNDILDDSNIISKLGYFFGIHFHCRS